MTPSTCAEEQAQEAGGDRRRQEQLLEQRHLPAQQVADDHEK